MFRRFLVLLWLALVGVVGLGSTGTATATTTPGAARYTYDVPTIARVDVQEIGAAGAEPAELSIAREVPALPAVETAGASTTPSATGVATEAGESWAATRAGELQAQLPAGSQGRVTMGAGVLEDASGNQIRVISTSEPNGYLRPGVTTQPGEIVISGTGHAEADIVAYAEANGYRVVTIGAGRPVCAACATTITGSGGTAATPLKGPK